MSIRNASVSIWMMILAVLYILMSGMVGHRPAEAAVVFIEDSSQIFRDFRGANPYVGLFPEGDRLVFSAKVRGTDPHNSGSPDPGGNPPPGSNKDRSSSLTSVIATSSVNGAVVHLFFRPSPLITNEFVRSRPFNPSVLPTGDWHIRVENTSGSFGFQERTNPGIWNVGQLPLVEAPMLDGAGTLSWTIPTTTEIFNEIRVDILAGPGGLPPDLARFPGFPLGVPAGRMLDQAQPGAVITSINIKDPGTFRDGLKVLDGDNLVARIRLEYRDNTRSIGRLINRSSTFVSFTVLSDGTCVQVPSRRGEKFHSFRH